MHLIGWVSPDLALYRELSAHENVRFFAAVRGISLTEAEIDALLERVGLHGRGHDRVACYSSGMVQRLRYAYALLHNPAVLLLDEPTVTLDERGMETVETIVNAQRERGITVIATNDPRELRFADYLLTLDTA
jgi:heme exporter protein A